MPEAFRYRGSSDWTRCLPRLAPGRLSRPGLRVSQNEVVVLAPEEPRVLDVCLGGAEVSRVSRLIRFRTPRCGGMFLLVMGQLCQAGDMHLDWIARLMRLTDVAADPVRDGMHVFCCSRSLALGTLGSLGFARALPGNGRAPPSQGASTVRPSAKVSGLPQGRSVSR